MTETGRAPKRRCDETWGGVCNTCRQRACAACPKRDSSESVTERGICRWQRYGGRILQEPTITKWIHLVTSEQRSEKLQTVTTSLHIMPILKCTKSSVCLNCVEVDNESLRPLESNLLNHVGGRLPLGHHHLHEVDVGDRLRVIV